MTAAERATSPRIAVIGAFPFPLELGSQIFVRDQMRALARAGAEPTLLCYGTGNDDDVHDLAIERVSGALSARRLRAGPSFWKPVSDTALIRTFVAAQRRQRFDVALAHNGEAALAALAARPLTGVPVVYVAHTLLGEELPHWGPAAFDRALGAGGRALGRLIARRCDGVLALCEDAAARFRDSARGPVVVIPPGLDPEPCPDAALQARVCARLGLAPGDFAIYSGNLDRYQDLGLLGEAAALLPGREVVVATHGPGTAPHPALRTLRVRDRAEMRALVAAAGVAVLPRRTRGGFPIKLLGYMEAETPIIAFDGIADGLVHDVSACLLPLTAGAEALAAAIEGLLADSAHAQRLGAAARQRLETAHDWRSLAEQTLALLARVCERSVAAA
jgi:glycosyltransferase involved in cell wall biosynthesis